MRGYLRWGFVGVAVAAAVAGCGGSSGNGVASKSPEAIVTTAGNAAANAKSVHVAGSFNSSGEQITMDLDLQTGKASGSMAVNGLSFKLVYLGGKVYINASPGFWTHFGGATAAALLKGKWLSAPDTGQFASITSFANVHELFSKLTATHGSLVKGKTTKIDGRKVIAVSDTTKGGTLYVATTGKPYPIAVVKNGGAGGRIDFSNYDKSVAISAPANAVDVTKLLG